MRVGYLARLGAVALVGLAAAYVAISLYAALEFTRAERVPVETLPEAIGPGHQDVTFPTADGLALRGWFFPAAGDRAAIVVHGKDANRADGDHLQRLARILLSSGYNLLLFDLRGHGESAGERFSLGLHERKDVAAAVDHLVARGFPVRRIALVGESMGAGTVIQALALRPGVGAVVADSAYADGRTIVEDAGPSDTGLPGIFTPGILLGAKLLVGLDADLVDPERIVRSRPDRAFLFIHCDLDGVVPPKHAERLRAASANGATELWLASGCGHVGALARYPAEYERRLLAFLAAQMR